MKITLDGLARWSAIGGLALLIALLVPIIWITNQTNGLALSAAEWAKARIAELRG